MILITSNVCQELKSLTVIQSGLMQLGNNFFKSISDGFPQIYYLQLSNSRLINQQVFADMEGRLKNVRELALFRCDGINDRAMEIIGNKFDRLQSISLSIGPLMSEYAMIQMIKKLSAIRSLKLCDRNQKVGNKTLEAISASCPQLSMLCLGFCYMVTNDGVENLVRQCKKLR